MHPDVEIVANGPAGVMHYREGKHHHGFPWELGAGRVVLSIYVTAADEWDVRLPWAAGRRDEVMRALAREVRRQQCRTCGVEFHDRWIHLTEYAPLKMDDIATRIRRLLSRWLGREG